MYYLLYFTKQEIWVSENGNDMSKFTHLVQGEAKSQGNLCDSRNTVAMWSIIGDSKLVFL